jgi:hypothetical protein
MNAERTYNSIIIGGGPAGSFAARELQPASDVVIIEKGTALSKRVCPMTENCVGCNSCGEVEGIGGAGGWSDGKLCLGEVGILDSFLGDHYSDEVRTVNQVFRDLLQDRYVLPNDRVGLSVADGKLTQEVTEVANLGTSTIRLAFQRLYQQALESGNQFILNDPVVNVDDDGKDNFIVQTNSGKEFHARNVIVSTGKGDVTIMPQLIERYKLETIPTEPTLGVRLVVPNEELQEMKNLGNNPKLKLHLPNGDVVKTHCFTFGGEVMAYLSGSNLLVGGRSDYLNPTDFSTVNILYKFSAGDPKERKEEVRNTLQKMQADYPRNVIYQDVGSFFDPTQDPRETTVPACRGGKLGNILSYYPSYVVEAIREFINNMASAYGVNVNRATIFSPAAEWLNDAVATSMEMETTRKGLYIVGDGSGITQGIISAAVTGYRAAHSIKSRE